MSDYEFEKHLYAHVVLKTLQPKYERAREELISDISPACMTSFTDTGELVQISRSVEDQALDLITLYEIYKEKAKRWKKRHQLILKAAEYLSAENRNTFHQWLDGQEVEINTFIIELYDNLEEVVMEEKREWARAVVANN